MFKFPEEYVRNLEKYPFPDWSSASFNEESDSALWGHYAQAHQGVCMKFRRDVFFLDEIKEEKSVFYKVYYPEGFPEIDFFRHTIDKNGKLIDLNRLINNWPDEYKADFIKICTTKLKPWENEKEWRLLYIQHNKEDRKKRYCFESLHGIIFGINTNSDDRQKIINLIRKKCDIEKREKNTNMITDKNGDEVKYQEVVVCKNKPKPKDQSNNQTILHKKKEH